MSWIILCYIHQALEFMIDGYAGTAMSMSSLVYRLAMHPDIQDKLYADVMEKLDTFVSASSFSMPIRESSGWVWVFVFFFSRGECHMKWFLKWLTLINSSVKLPVYNQLCPGLFPFLKLWFKFNSFSEKTQITQIFLNRIDRQCCKDITYGNFTIKKGMNVQIPVYTLHHSEEYFPNPEVFDPDRFVDTQLILMDSELIGRIQHWFQIQPREQG